MTVPTYATGLSTPFRGGTTGFSNKHQPGLVVQKIDYDVSLFTGTTTQSINIMTIPAFSTLQSLQVIVVTALTLSGTPTVNVGDTSDRALFVAAASTLTAGTVLTQALTTNPLKFYAAADKLTLSLTGATIFPGTGLIRFVVGLIDCTRDAPMTT